MNNINKDNVNNATEQSVKQDKIIAIENNELY